MFKNVLFEEKTSFGNLTSPFWLEIARYSEPKEACQNPKNRFFPCKGQDLSMR